MNLAVIGQTHLGQVTAACLAAAGHTVRTWGEGTCGPEPQLEERRQVAGPRLVTTQEFGEAVKDVDVVWFTEDTPVDDRDRGDADGLIARVLDVLRHVTPWQVVILSSQVPIGTTERIASLSGHRRLAYVPENLKKGAGVARFVRAERYIVGLVQSDNATRAILHQLLWPFSTTRNGVIFMPVRAAEATKHAINSYLAACITLANELGQICAAHGIDPAHVELGLRTDARVGNGPPVTPGGPIRGGTLLRDVWYLEAMAERLGLDLPLVKAIHASNTLHLRRDETSKGVPA